MYSAYLINRPCIIIGRKGSSGALNICYTDSWTTDVAYYCSPTRELDLEYIYITLKALELEKLGKGIKPGLNRNEAYLEILSIPPLSEQKRIISKVDQTKTHYIQSRSIDAPLRRTRNSTQPVQKRQRNAHAGSTT